MKAGNSQAIYSDEWMRVEMSAAKYFVGSQQKVFVKDMLTFQSIDTFEF